MKQKRALAVMGVVLLLLVTISVVVFAFSWSDPVEMGWGRHWDTFPEAAADRNGNVFVVWTTYPDDQHLWFNSFDGVSWGRATRPHVTNFTNFNADIAVDTAGRAHVVWSGYDINWNPDIYYSMYDGNAWSGPERMGMHLQGNPTVTVDSSGEVFVAQQVSVNEIFFVHGDGHHTWSTPSLVTRSNCFPDLSVDNNDVIHLAYCDPDHRPAFRTWLGSTWSDETHLDGFCSTERTPVEMFHSDNGNSDFLCLSGGDIFHWHGDQNGWSDSFEVTTSNSFGIPDATGAPNGVIAAIWVEGDPHDPYVRIWTGSKWLPPERVADTGSGSLWSTVGISSNNQAVAIWSENIGYPFVLNASIAELVFPIEVGIDIKPGNEPNSVNCINENGVVSVALLTTSEFDALTVDHTTVIFEGAAETHRNNLSGEVVRHEEDVDRDGDIDLVFHFRLGETELSCESTMGVLTGETFEGILIEGQDSVRMVKGSSNIKQFAAELMGPFGMAFDEENNLFVANEWANESDAGVSRITPRGEVFDFATGLIGASGMGFNSEGTLFVSDNSNRVFSVSDTGELTVFVNWDVGLDNPNAIAFDENDNLYTVSCGGFISWFDADGSLMNLTLADGFNCPQSIVVDDSVDLLYISDSEGNIFQINKYTGDMELFVATSAITEGGLIIDSQGDLYLSAWEINEVLRIQRSDGSVSTCLSGVTAPRGLAFDSKNRLYVTAYETGEIYRARACQ